MRVTATVGSSEAAGGRSQESARHLVPVDEEADTCGCAAQREGWHAGVRDKACCGLVQGARNLTAIIPTTINPTAMYESNS